MIPVNSLHQTTLFGVEAPRLHRTIWYMGAKARVIPGFLDKVIEEEVPRGGAIADVMSGTGIVAAFCADGRRVHADDVQEYAAAIARSLLEHEPGGKAELIASIHTERDLRPVYASHLAALEDLYAPALAREAELLGRFRNGDDGPEWLEEYRQFLLEPGGHHACERGPAPSGGLYESARDLLSPASLARYREDPARRPACLATAYYANIYFGLRQALEIDSLRAAIDGLEGAKRVHYLSALLHAASVSTSGTSHFAQPRQLTKDSEVRAMAKRRTLGIFEQVAAYSSEIIKTVRATRHVAGNRVTCGDYGALIATAGGESQRFDFPGGVDLVYLDPPYTMDHYSRFYHVLEVLARYDYPLLETGARGNVVRGRYPRIDGRFQSSFCNRKSVEGEFRRVARAASGAGAKLVISYSTPSGLLLKEYAHKFSGVDPVTHLEALCLECFAKVETRRLPLLHSGQGDKNLDIEEILVICKDPRGAKDRRVG